MLSFNLSLFSFDSVGACLPAGIHVLKSVFKWRMISSNPVLLILKMVELLFPPVSLIAIEFFGIIFIAFSGSNRWAKILAPTTNSLQSGWKRGLSCGHIIEPEPGIDRRVGCWISFQRSSFRNRVGCCVHCWRWGSEKTKQTGSFSAKKNKINLYIEQSSCYLVSNSYCFSPFSCVNFNVIHMRTACRTTYETVSSLFTSVHPYRKVWFTPTNSFSRTSVILRTILDTLVPT